MRSENSDQFGAAPTDLSACEDEDLMSLFRRTGNDSLREKIRDEIFGRYYLGIERKLAKVFKFRGIRYSDLTPFYNSAFDAIYDKVFSIGEFEIVVRKFDSNRGSFKHWFLNRIVENRIRDWLRVHSTSAGIKNVDRLHSWETSTFSLEDKKGCVDRKDVSDYIRCLEDGRKQRAVTLERQIQYALEQLEPKDRIFIKLLHLPGSSITADEKHFLARRTGRNEAALQDEISQIVLLLSKRHEAQERKEDQLLDRFEVIRLSSVSNEEQLHRLLLRMTHMGYGDGRIKALATQAKDHTIMGIKLESRKIKRDYAKGEIRTDVAFQRRIVLDFMSKHLIRSKYLGEVDRIRSRLGRLPGSPYKEVAQLFGCRREDIYTQKRVALHRLSNLLRTSKWNEETPPLHASWYSAHDICKRYGLTSSEPRCEHGAVQVLR